MCIAWLAVNFDLPRSTPVTLKLLHVANYAKRAGKEATSLDAEWEAPKKVRGVQMALYNHAAACRALWPMDYTPETIGQVLVKAEWGGISRTDAVRASLIEQLFDRCMIENASRAVKRKPPADYRRVKEIWDDISEGAGPVLPTPADKSGGGQNNRGQASGGSRDGKNNRGGKGAHFVPDGFKMKVCKVGSLYVCHRYNDPPGCARTAQGQGCKTPKGQVFAHNCNFLKKNGEFCLAVHPRHSVHK